MSESVCKQWVAEQEDVTPYFFILVMATQNQAAVAFPVRPRDGQAQLRAPFSSLPFSYTAVQEMALCPWAPLQLVLGPGNPLALMNTN